MRRKHRLLKTVAIAGGSIAVLLATLQIAVNSRIADNFIDRFVAENVDGNLSYSAMHVSLIKAFPDIRVTIDSMALTYPHNRFSAYDDFGMKSVLKFSGCGEEIDTLAALRRFDVSVNPWKLLGSTVKLDKLQIDGLHLYAHEYGSSLANWKMFRFGAEEKEDAEKPLPDIYIGELSISDARNIVYTSIPSAMALRLSVDQLNLSGYRDYTMFLRSALLAQLPGISELDIPVQVDGIVGFRQNKGKMRFDLPSLDARIAHIPIHIEGNASVRDGSVPLDLNLEVKDCSIDSLLRVYVYKLAPATRDIKARAMLNLSARASGVYSKQSMPTVDASVSIPGGTVQYVPYGATGLLDLSAGVKDLLDERIALIDKILIDKMSGTSMSGKAIAKEIENMTADRDSFIRSLGLLYSVNHPQAIRKLKEYELTEEEIGLCCLYYLGYSGKEVKEISRSSMIYHMNSTIRQKIGLKSNEMNLSTYMKQLFGNRIQ